MDFRVARRYARALFAAARKEGIVHPVEQDLDGIFAAMQHKEGFRRFFMSPEANRDDKLSLVEQVFSDRVTALTMSLLRLLLAKRREQELDLVRLEYAKLRWEHENITHAVIESARPLASEQQDAVVAKVQSLTGKTVDPEFHVRADLIGGVRVTYENNVLDGTVRGSLTRLRETLVYDVLKQA